MSKTISLYSDSVYQTTKRLLIRRAVSLSVLLLVLLVGGGIFIAMRMQAAAIALSIVLGSVILFLFSLKLEPVIRYMSFLRNMALGQRRQAVVAFMDMTGQPALRDNGVECFAMRVLQDEDERIIYVDSNLPTPEFSPGEQLSVETFGTALVAYAREGA